MKKINIVLSSILLFILLISPVFSWLFYSINLSANINGATVESYFHRGDGTVEHPFTITKPVHLYNLSKLQEAGAFGSTHYYFQVGIETTCSNEVCTIVDDANALYRKDNADVITPLGAYTYLVYDNNGELNSTILDMSTLNKNGDTFIIPIGGSQITKDTTGADLTSDKYYSSQFLGFFEGHNLTIKNLQVIANEKFCHVGMFGAIGKGALVENFILDNPKIETTATTPVQLAYPELNITGDFNNYIGILAGYSNGGLYNIGIYKGDFKISSTLYKSKFSWLGYGTTAITNTSDAGGNVLDYTIRWGYLVQQMGVKGTTWNSWSGTNGNFISTNYNTTVSNLFTDTDESNDPYNKNVFELVSPLIMQKTNSANVSFSGSYNFPQQHYNASGIAEGIELATAPPEYEQIITTNHVYDDGTGIDTVFQATGSSSTLINGQGGIRFNVDNAGDLLLTYSTSKSSTLAVYKKGTGSTYTPYTDADWTFGTGKVANPTTANVRIISKSATATAYPFSPAPTTGSVVTLVVRIKSAGQYIIGTSSGEPCAFAYTRFIIDSQYGNTGGLAPTGSSDKITSIDFTYMDGENILFPNAEGYTPSRVNLYFPPTSTIGYTIPIIIYYRRDKNIGIITFNVLSPVYNSLYYIGKQGNGIIILASSD